MCGVSGFAKEEKENDKSAEIGFTNSLPINQFMEKRSYHPLPIFLRFEDQDGLIRRRLCAHVIACELSCLYTKSLQFYTSIVVVGNEVFYDWFFAADQAGATTIRERVTNHTYNSKGEYTVNVTARNGISSKVMNVTTNKCIYTERKASAK